MNEWISKYGLNPKNKGTLFSTNLKVGKNKVPLFLGSSSYSRSCAYIGLVVLLNALNHSIWSTNYTCIRERERERERERVE